MQLTTSAAPQHYRLIDPVNDLAVAVVNIAEPGQPERLAARLVPADDATRFTTARAANNAWAAYVGPQHLELVRVDA